MTSFRHVTSWHPMAPCDSLWHLVTTYDTLWHPMTPCDTLWHLVTHRQVPGHVPGAAALQPHGGGGPDLHAQLPLPGLAAAPHAAGWGKKTRKKKKKERVKERRQGKIKGIKEMRKRKSEWEGGKKERKSGERERERDRQTDRQTDKHTERLRTAHRLLASHQHWSRVGWNTVPHLMQPLAIVMEDLTQRSCPQPT